MIGRTELFISAVLIMVSWMVMEKFIHIKEIVT